MGNIRSIQHQYVYHSNESDGSAVKRISHQITLSFLFCIDANTLITIYFVFFFSFFSYAKSYVIESVIRIKYLHKKETRQGMIEIIYVGKSIRRNDVDFFYNTTNFLDHAKAGKCVYSSDADLCSSLM